MAFQHTLTGSDLLFFAMVIDEHQAQASAAAAAAAAAGPTRTSSESCGPGTAEAVRMTEEWFRVTGGAPRDRRRRSA